MELQHNRSISMENGMPTYKEITQRKPSASLACSSSSPILAASQALCRPNASQTLAYHVHAAFDGAGFLPSAKASASSPGG